MKINAAVPTKRPRRPNGSTAAEAAWMQWADDEIARLKRVLLQRELQGSAIIPPTKVDLACARGRPITHSSGETWIARRGEGGAWT
jgi:hypothetical protein